MADKGVISNIEGRVRQLMDDHRRVSKSGSGNWTPNWRGCSWPKGLREDPETGRRHGHA